MGGGGRGVHPCACALLALLTHVRGRHHIMLGMFLQPTQKPVWPKHGRPSWQGRWAPVPAGSTPHHPPKHLPSPRLLLPLSRLADVIPRERQGAFLAAAVARLAPGNPTAVQIGACKAVAQLAKSVPPVEVQAASQQMFAGKRRGAARARVAVVQRWEKKLWGGAGSQAATTVGAGCTAVQGSHAAARPAVLAWLQLYSSCGFQLCPALGGVCSQACASCC